MVQGTYLHPEPQSLNGDLNAGLAGTTSIDELSAWLEGQAQKFLLQGSQKI